MMRQHKNQNYRMQRRGGFTLVELMVVLVIASIVSGLTLSGFKSLTKSNQRTSCQTNMVQIYQALRLYSADENGGFPPYDASSASPGIGLWALYTYPSSTTTSGIATPDDTTVPIERYLRHAKSLHCPADDADADETLLVPDTKNPLQQMYNVNYLSYQTLDTALGAAASTLPQDEATYQPGRTTDKSGCTSSTPDCDWKRQLLHYDGGNLVVRPPTDDTIVMWCKWHRPADITSDTTRPYDNVLFYDGTVRYLSVTQLQGATTVAEWHRAPSAP